MVAAYSPPGPRMTLASIKSTRQADKPVRLVIYSTPGVGKTTFCAEAPNPVFLLGEAGASFLDVPAFPRPLNWWDVLEAVQTLINEEHDRRSLVLDTLDGLEPLVFEHVCKTNGGKKSIEDLPYGRGYTLALEEWRKLLARLEWLQEKRGMNVLLTAHAVAREFKDPNVETAWKRWDMKLHAKTADEIAGWADAVLFATHEALPKKDGLRVRGVSTGERLILTNWTAAYSAKNRYGLPPTLPLDWSAFWSAAQPALRPAPDPEVERELRILKTDLATLIPQLDADASAKALVAVVDAGDDLTRLRKIRARVDALLTSATATV